MNAMLALVVLALAALGAWPPRAAARMPDASPAAAVDAMPGPASGRMSNAVSNAVGTVAASDVARFMRRITAVGATKPPGAVLDHRLGTSPRLDLASQLLDRRIRTAICPGC